MVRLLRSVVRATHGAIDPTALLAEGIAPRDVIDFSSNQAPLGAAPAVAVAVGRATVDSYPDPLAADFCAAAAAMHGVPANTVVAGNGCTELIRLVAQLALRPGDSAVAVAPCFGEYVVATELAAARLTEVRLAHRGHGRGFACDETALRSALAAKPRLCWLCSPNNPTGATVGEAAIAEATARHPDTLFVLDEAYCDLLPAPQWSLTTLSHGNLIVLRSMTKSWGLAGLRLGYAVAAPETAAALRAAAPPWTVNACAQAAGVVAFADVAHHSATLHALASERDRMRAELRVRGWIVEPTAAGFFLVYVGDAASAWAALLAHGCLVRDCTSFGLPGHIRVSPRRPHENDHLLRSLGGLARPSSG
jgi:histidinol-phosphate aminotransferase